MSSMDGLDYRLQLDHNPSFNNSFKQIDYYRIPPTNGIDNVNRSGDISFRCNNKQMLLSLFESLIKVKLKLTGQGDTMSLEHNFFPRMLNSIRLMFGKNEIEALTTAPGEAATMINFVVANETFRRTYGHIAGWMPDSDKMADDAKNTGYVIRKNLYKKDAPTIFFPLRLIFGFIDYKKVLYLIDNITLTLNRKADADIVKEIFFGTAKIKNSATPAVEIDPAIEFTELEWWIPNLTPNLEVEKIFKERLNKDKNIEMTYMKRHSTSVTFSATKYQWTIAGIAKQVRYIFLAFKSKVALITNNNSLFTAKKIRSIQIRINGQLYPETPMRFNVEQGDIAEPYLAYIEACAYFNTEPQLTATEWGDLYPIICINTSSQNEILKDGNEAFVIIEKDGNDQYEIFALCLEDTKINYNLANGVVTNL
jgi:hypothetical protein